VTDRYLFSRKDWSDIDSLDTVDLATWVFFQMWKTRAFPYSRFSENDVVYIGDPTTRRIHWEVRVSNLLSDFGYTSTRHALGALRSAYGLYSDDLNNYHRDKAGKGWLFAWSPTVMRHLDVALPDGIRFGRNGYQLLADSDCAAIGLPKPKAHTPLATPPTWYDPAAARTSERRNVPRYIPTHVRSEVIARDQRMCAGCGANRNLHIDHIVPYSHGGPPTVDNLRLLCAKSNLERSVGDPNEPPPCASD
jgi:5-methylcytosine-specific restriction endonuclease McrA